MVMRDLHMLPKVRDSWSYLYVEHAKIDQEAKAIAIHDAEGKTPVPCASLSVLMLGPGTSITHRAILTLAKSGCLVIWAGEEGVRFYAQGQGETRSARNLLHQARLVSDDEQRLRVVRRMYAYRFNEPIEPELTLQQIRGREGARVRDAYANASRETGVPWHGRSVGRESWQSADPVNRALSTANACLYGICHAAIVAAGYSPALGFIHTGKQRSFVFDIADLYKVETTIPTAFTVAAEGDHKIETRVRYSLRDAFREHRVLPTLVQDINWVLSVDEDDALIDDTAFDGELAIPGGLWDPELGSVAGGVNYADDSDGSGSTVRMED